jgi:GPH family glycoside/pentoside/hexuronide:cation symporter
MFRKRDQIFFAQGSLGFNVIWLTMITWLVFFYAPPEGKGVALLPVALAGALLFVGRVIDAFTDVLVGFWSDNATYKRGRRVPFILVGVPLLGISFFLLWLPPIAGPTVIAIYLFMMINLHFLAMTFVYVPFHSLIPELAVTHNERLSVSAWMALFGTIGTTIAAAGSAPLIAKVGYPIMGVIFGLIVAAAFYIALLGVKEKPLRADSEVRLNLKDAFKKTISNQQFLFSMIPIICLHFGFGLLAMSLPFFVTVVLGLTEGHVMVYQGGPILVMIACLPLWRWVGNRYGKKRGFSLCLKLIAAWAPLYFIVGTFPGAAILSMIYLSLMMVPVSGLFVFHNALIADVTDYDELRTGKRREGMYFSIWNFMMKVNCGLTFLVFGFLGTLGLAPGDFLGIQMVGPVVAAAAFLGFLVFRKYQLPDTIRGKTLKEIGFTE